MVVVREGIKIQKEWLHLQNTHSGTTLSLLLLDKSHWYEIHWSDQFLQDTLAVDYSNNTLRKAIANYKQPVQLVLSGPSRYHVTLGRCQTWSQILYFLFFRLLLARKAFEELTCFCMWCFQVVFERQFLKIKYSWASKLSCFFLSFWG